MRVKNDVKFFARAGGLCIGRPFGDHGGLFCKGDIGDRFAVLSKPAVKGVARIYGLYGGLLHLGPGCLDGHEGSPVGGECSGVCVKDDIEFSAVLLRQGRHGQKPQAQHQGQQECRNACSLHVS